MVKLFQELMTINMMINKKLLLFAGLWIIATIFVFSFVKVPSDNLGGDTASSTENIVDEPVVEVEPVYPYGIEPITIHTVKKDITLSYTDASNISRDV